MKHVSFVVLALVGTSGLAFAEGGPAAAAAPAAKPAEAAAPAKAAEPKAEAKAEAAATGEWKVEAKLCKTIEDRECKDPSDTFAETDGTVVAWNKVSGPETGGLLHHVWFKGDEEMSDIEVKVGGSPWRTWTRKTLGEKPQGDWRVEIRDAGGAVIETLKFKVQ